MTLRSLTDLESILDRLHTAHENACMTHSRHLRINHSESSSERVPVCTRQRGGMRGVNGRGSATCDVRCAVALG